MITAELRARAEELKKTECVHRGAWHDLIDELIVAAERPADFGLPEAQEPKYTINDHGRIVNRATGVAIPDEEPIMIFRAKDAEAGDAIDYYIDCCADENHQRVVSARVESFRKFASEHPERMKEPDSPT